MNSISIFYFSGTGGTELAAVALAENLAGHSRKIQLIPLTKPMYPELDKKETGSEISFLEKPNPEELKRLADKAEELILLFPVYAVAAPWPVMHWLETLDGKNRKTGVISVSGGGEVWPNTGCRESCCRKLEEKGFKVTYEKMLIMPPNVVTNRNKDLMIRILRALPKKAAETAKEYIESSDKRERNKKPSPLVRLMTRMENSNGKIFARYYDVSEKCTECGWCARNCPTGNITMKLGRPQFGKSCAICLRCVYGCPAGVITSSIPFIFKDGFNIRNIEKEFEGKIPAPLEKCAKSLVWKGVRKYLKKDMELQ